MRYEYKTSLTVNGIPRTVSVTISHSKSDYVSINRLNAWSNRLKDIDPTGATYENEKQLSYTEIEDNGDTNEGQYGKALVTVKSTTNSYPHIISFVLDNVSRLNEPDEPYESIEIAIADKVHEMIGMTMPNSVLYVTNVSVYSE